MSHAIGIVSISLLCGRLAALTTTLVECSTTPAVEFVEKRGHDRYVAAVVYNSS